MNTIHLLPSKIINQIAAGEVIERPSAVVKELIENAQDASATQIDIELIDGGKNLIAIQDNGVGMSKEDIQVSYIRHTTSKFTDFDNIKTFGFRGEALASIASISETTITSKMAKDKYSFSVKISNGDLTDSSEGFAGDGTRIEVSNLFYSTPSRLKFLKSTNYELALIMKTIKQFALCSPHIHFTCYHNKRKIFSTFGVENRIELVLGEHFIENSMKISYTLNNIIVNGYASLPTYTKTNHDHKWIFVNNRIIQDKIFHKAISNAYRDVIAHGAHPVVFLQISLPGDEVDINVHPQKKEARFLNSNEMHKACYNAITEAIYKNGKRSISLTDVNQLFPPIAENKSESKFDYVAPADSYDTLNDSGSNQVNDDVALYQHKPISDDKISNSQFDYSDTELNSDIIQTEIEENAKINLGIAIGQFRNKYIISCDNQNLILVDQHACHERILYEKLKESYSSAHFDQQSLLDPISTSITEITDENIDKLNKFGFEVSKINGYYHIVKHPSLIKANFEKVILSILNDLNKDINYEIANISCHNAIRSGLSMTIPEMNSFLRLVEKSDMSGQCNHGRPTYVKISMQKLDRLFERI